MQTKWTLVKISQATRARLERVRESMLLADESGQRSLERDPRDRVSLDQVIGLLIDMRARHSVRRRRAAAKRRGRPVPVEVIVDLDTDAEYDEGTSCE